jgi:predicted ATPase
VKTRRTPTASRRRTGAPFLHRIATLPEKLDQTRYPFNIKAFSHGIDLTFRSKVTFFVGENGSGKSTLLEAIAECCGFNPEGGNRDHHRAVFADRSPLAQALRLSWLPKVTEGFFMRAESFYNFASYIEEVSDLRAYGGRSLHAIAWRVVHLPVCQSLRAGHLHSR